MRERVQAFARRYRLFDGVQTVVAACSGGADSVALVYLLRQLSEEFGYRLIIAHVDHGLRGEESAADRCFVEQMATELRLPVHAVTADVRDYARQQQLSQQEAAREVRYAWLYEVAAQYPAAVIATGHHRGDQAETVLLHLLRGAGSCGLGGIRPRRGQIIRPLLCLERKETEAVCRAYQIVPRFDSSNAKTNYMRNRIRLELLPLLEQRFASQSEKRLSQVATILSDEYAFIRQSAQERLAEMDPSLLLDNGGECQISRSALAAQPVALQREMLRQLVERITGNGKGISLGHVEKMIDMNVAATVGSRLALPGNVEVVFDYAELMLRKKMEAVVLESLPERQIAIPGTTLCPEWGFAVEAEIVDCMPEHLSADEAIFDAALLPLPLQLRQRQGGDRFAPRGGAGGKKLKEYFIDRKISREERDKIPLLCHGAEVLWICGRRMARLAAPTGKTERFVHVKVIKMRRE